MAARPLGVGRRRRPRPGAWSAETATLALIAASAAARLVMGAAMGLCYGESYYFSCARHPSLSYFDHPPLSQLVGWASMALAGRADRLVLRAPFVAMFAASTWLLFALGRRCFGPWAGFWAALLLNLAPVFTVSVGLFIQPDGPLILCWAACALCLSRLLIGPAPARPTRWWAAAGLLLGLGLLSKYHAALLAVGATLVMLIRPDQRRWLRHPGPYLAIALAAVLSAPVLLWNARHAWISFRWQSTRGLDQLQGLHPDWMLTNIAGQALVLLPWLWLALAVELGRGLAGRGPAGEARRVLAWLAVTPIVLFTLVALYAVPAQTHFHWGMPGYFLLFAPLGDSVHRALAARRAWARPFVAATAVASVLGIGAVTGQVARGWLTQGTTWWTGLVRRGEDPSLECVDWTALQAAFAERGLLDRPDVFVFSDWWYRAGKVDFGLRGRLPVLAFNPRDPRAYAFFGGSAPHVGRDGILVTTKASVEEVRRHFGDYFAAIHALGPVVIRRAGAPVLTVQLYRCERLLRPYPLPYGA